ncbi:MAG: alpha-2-macroglobulin family protein, partial [Acidobacteriota bacterium]
MRILSLDDWRSIMADPELRTDWMNDPRNLTIGLLVLVVLLLGGMVLQDRLPAALELPTGAAETGEPVRILDVVLDRDGLRSLDVLFDRPVAEGRVGEVLGVDAATVRPPIAGVWRWQGDSVLRFEPSGGFGMAMEYEFDLVPDRVLPPGKVLQDDGAFEVVTDQFQVERIDLYQEPAPDGEGVVIRGAVTFNYAVDPEQLAPNATLVDPARGASDPVALSLETYWPQQVIEFRTAPVDKRRRERELTLRIDRALTPAEGNVALTADVTRSVTIGSSENLAVWEVLPEPGDPESRLVLRLSSLVDPGLVSRYVQVSPEVEYRVSARRNDLVLAGDFEPGSSYTVRLQEGLPARDEAVLRQAFSRTIRLPDLEPRLGFESEGMFLAARGERALALEAVNVDRGHLVIERVYRNNLFYLFNSHGWIVWDDRPWSGTSIAHALGDRIVDATIGVGGERNRVRRVPLDVDRWVEGEEPGLYRIVVARQGDGQARQRWVMVTDLGLVAKRAGSELLVWASSFSDLSPVAGARVQVISDQNQVIAQGRTDGSGLWRGETRGGVGTPWMVTIERGDDYSFLLLDAMRVDTTGLDVGGATPEAGGYEAFLYGERDLYRPGETVEGVAVVRDRRLQPPPSMPLVMRHLDPSGVETTRFRVEMDDQGLAPFDLEVAAYARTGVHDLELRAGDRTIGRYRFQVEEFVPDRIRVEVEGPDSGALGEELPFAVEAAYLFGPPAGDLPVEARIRLEAAEFRPGGWGQYSFSDSRREFPGTEAFQGSGRLDARGRAEFRAPLPEDLRVPSSLTAVITARVQEQAGRGVASRLRVDVDPVPYYLGLRRTGQGYAEPGAAETFEWVAVEPSGDAAEAGRLRAELYREEWQTVLRRTSSGAFRYESTRDFRLLDSREIEAGETAGSLAFTPPQLGAYRVVITDPVTGASSDVSFTASGGGFSPWAIENPARVDLELDRDEYRPGDVARVQVRAPFAGRLLLTVERQGVRYTQVHDMAGNTATLRVPVAGELRPNAYVTATVVRA